MIGPIPIKHQVNPTGTVLLGRVSPTLASRRRIARRSRSDSRCRLWCSLAVCCICSTLVGGYGARGSPWGWGEGRASGQRRWLAAAPKTRRGGSGVGKVSTKRLGWPHEQAFRNRIIAEERAVVSTSTTQWNEETVLQAVRCDITIGGFLNNTSYISFNDTKKTHNDRVHFNVDKIKTKHAECNCTKNPLDMEINIIHNELSGCRQPLSGDSFFALIEIKNYAWFAHLRLLLHALGTLLERLAARLAQPGERMDHRLLPAVGTHPAPGLLHRQAGGMPGSDSGTGESQLTAPQKINPPVYYLGGCYLGGDLT